MAVLMLLIILIILNSVLSIYTKKILNKGIHPLLLLSISGISIGIISMPFIYSRFSLPALLISFLLLAALLRVLAAWNLNISTKLSEVSFITPFSTFASIFGIIFGAILLRDYPTVYGVFGIALLFIGSFLLFRLEKPFPYKAVGYKILGTLFIALSAIALRHTLKFTDFISSTMFLWFFLGLLSIPIAFFMLKRAPHRKAVKRTKSLMVIIIILALVVSLLQIYLFSQLQVGYVFGFLQVGLLLNVALAGKFLNEKNFTRRILPTIFMVLGVVLIYYLG